MTSFAPKTICMITRGRHAGEKAEVVGASDKKGYVEILTQKGKKRTMSALHVFPLYNETGPLSVAAPKTAKKARSTKG